MSLFVCSECGVVENTALCMFWARGAFPTEALCSMCDPAVGCWHGVFPREQYDGTQNVAWKDGKWVHDE